MSEAARAKRAAALEEKKKRLEQLKARRQATAAASSLSKSSSIAGVNNLDELIDGLLKTAAPVIPGQAPPQPPTPSPATPTNGVASGTSTPLRPGSGANVIFQQTPQQFVTTPVAPLPPVPVVETFTFGTQTDVEELPDDPTDDDNDQDGDKEKEEDTTHQNGNSGPQGMTLEELSIVPEAKFLSPEERETEVKSAHFSAFLNSASKKVERLLGAPVLADLLVDADYTGDDEEISEEKSSKGKLVSADHTFEAPKWTATRDVTDLEWSPIHRELFLASYHAPSAGIGGAAASSLPLSAVDPSITASSASLAPRSGELQSDGLAVVWSLAMPTRPEHIFTCGSPVLSCRFHPTEPALVVGGCQSGQVVVWDVRAGRLPVQRSSLATVARANSHSHPICAMEIIEGGSGLVTAATDGRLNFWSLANLRDPAESLMVGENISSLAVAPEGNAIVVGDEMGSLHTILASASAATSKKGTPAKKKSARAGASKRPIRILGTPAALSETTEEGINPNHFGMVTAIASKVLPRNDKTTRAMSRGFLRGSSGLVLSTGVDWTTKLWAPAYTDQPLLSFLSHSYDYMCDVQWSPAHPSIFATASSNGTLGLWNLSSSLDEAMSGTEGIVVDGSSLNKIKWSADGRRLLVASGDKVHALGMSEEVWKVKGDEEARMMSNLTSRGYLQADE